LGSVLSDLPRRWRYFLIFRWELIKRAWFEAEEINACVYIWQKSFKGKLQMSSLVQKIRKKPDVCYHQRRGSTLIEVMLAAAILVIAVLGTSSSFVSGRRFIVNQRYYQAAAHLASQKLEQIKAAGYPDVNEGQENEEVSLFGDDYQRHTIVALTAVPTTSLPQPCKKVTVTIQWTGPARDVHQAKLVTYIGP
jgi:Tfp pilus assembly protein PilV